MPFGRVVPALGNYVKCVISARQRGVTGDMGIAAFISDRHPVVSFQIIIQFTLRIDKGKDTELDIQLGKVLRNFNITIGWIIGCAAVRHMDLDAVDDRIRNYIVSDIIIQIQRQHIAGTGQIKLLFIRIIVMTGINRQR